MSGRHGIARPNIRLVTYYASSGGVAKKGNEDATSRKSAAILQGMLIAHRDMLSYRCHSGSGGGGSITFVEACEDLISFVPTSGSFGSEADVLELGPRVVACRSV